MVVPRCRAVGHRPRRGALLALALSVLLLAATPAGAVHFLPPPPDVFGADCLPVALWGASDSDAAASALLPDLDLTGDGLPDLVVGVPRAKLDGNVFGAVYVVSPPFGTGGSLGAAHAVLKGPSPGSLAGHSVASAGDLNGDGIADLVVGAPSARPPGLGPGGVAFVFFGPVAAGTRSMWDADVILLGGIEHGFGSSVAGVGDIDGDGHDDLLVGAPGVGTPSDRHGAAFLFHGPLDGTLHWHEADQALMGKEANGQAGRTVAATGDMDGDGRPDLAVSAPYARGVRGVVYLVRSTELVATPFDLTTTLTRYVGERTSDGAGAVLVPLGDTDGDGRSDLLVGAPTATVDGIRDRGAAYLVRGGTDGEASLADVAVRFIGPPSGTTFATSAALVGDLDADGLPDLAIGAPTRGAGTVHLYHGFTRHNGTVTAAQANATVAGKAQWDGFGHALSAGDLDQNGRPDVVVGVPGEDGVGASRGAIRHFDLEDMRADRDEDGLLDGCEARRYRTDPDLRDSDEDGLYDGEEALLYRTDPMDRDTDGDLHSDLAEVIRHTDPLNPFHFPLFNRPVIIPVAPPFDELPVTDDLEPIY